MKMEFVLSNKGNEKLCLNGYSYTVHKVCKTKIRWRCSKYSSKNCYGLLTTTLEKTVPQLVSSHNHATDSEEINAVKAVCQMNTTVRETSKAPSQIFAEGVRSLPNTTRAKLRSEESVKRTLRRQRKINGAPMNPASLQDLRIEGNWKTTGETQDTRFLLSDNGPDADERIVIFATDMMLKLLDSAKEWWMDGTFEVSPSLFMQLYVLRVSVGNSLVTVAYCLLERKTKNTYMAMLTTIIAECESREVIPDPEIIHVDFEEAVMGAVKSVLGDEVHIQACFYHLTQSTYRKVQKLGLQVQYLEDESLSRFCGMLDGLAFLPLDRVEEGMEYLRNFPPPMGEKGMALLEYFDTTYVNGSIRQVGRPGDGSVPAKLRRIAPRFPKEFWNVNKITKESGDRTNNQTEGWNNRFRRLVGIAHPSIWSLIEKMRNEQAVDATKIAQRDAGTIQARKKRSEVVARQIKLLNICNAFDQGEHTVESFLKVISEAIRTRAQHFL